MADAPRRVLHLLSQRPGQTGSGVTLDCLVRLAARAGWEQQVAVGVPAGEFPAVGGLDAEAIRPVHFGTGELPFPVPGMSDVMPYASSRWSSLGERELTAYRDAWRSHVASLVREFRPDVIHAHHIWILGALAADAAPGIPVVSHCHATGFRQLELCPHLADEVRRGNARHSRFLVLHEAHAERLIRELGPDPKRVHVVGAGYDESHFHDRGRVEDPGPHLIYVGKYARAKGLPWLLDAVERLAPRWPGLKLHVCGSGSGEEADALRARMDGRPDLVVRHGVLSQAELGDRMRRCRLCVLPSFYEGLPLVLVEALACGCGLVATDLPGIRSGLLPALEFALRRIPMPRLETVDRPRPEDLPAFVDALEAALDQTLTAPPPPADRRREAIGAFGWPAIFARIEAVWRETIAESG